MEPKEYRRRVDVAGDVDVEVGRDLDIDVMSTPDRDQNLVANWSGRHQGPIGNPV